MTDHAPAFGVPPSLRALLSGTALYGGSVYRDLYCLLGYTWPDLIVDDRDALVEKVGGSRPMAGILRGIWTSSARMLDNKRGHTRLDNRVFQTNILCSWTEMRRMLDERSAIDFDWQHGLPCPLDELRWRMAHHLLMMGERSAVGEVVGVCWAYARRPGEGQAEILAAATGAELDEGAYSPRRTPGCQDLVDVLAQWRERGQQAILEAVAQMRGTIRDAVAEAMGAEAEPAAPRPSPLKRLAQIRAEEPAPEPDGPGLVVLASVSHLPGNTKDGEAKASSSSQNPRAEFAPIAGKRLPLVPVPDLAVQRNVLVGEFPYAEGIVDMVLRDLVGRPHVHVRPLLLVGPPGSGKTRLARRVAEVLGLGCQVYGCAGVADSTFLSTSRQWATGRGSLPLQLLKRLGLASGLIVLDELDKAGTGTTNGSLWDGLLPLLTDDARRYFDTYVEAQVDLSGVSYIATANNVAPLRKSHPALLDRFRIVAMPSPRREDLPVLLRNVMREIRQERGLDEHWLPDLDGEETALVEAHYQEGGSVRLVRRLAETVVAGREALAVRN